MNPKRTPVVILMAEDDADDRLLCQQALDESRVLNELHFVEDGEQLLDYLHRRPPFQDALLHPRPGLILLDSQL